MERRAFLLTPLVACGACAVAADRKPKSSGGTVTVIKFSDSGENQGPVQVQKVVKTDAEWKQQLSAEEFAVTRKAGTERAFTGRTWNNHETGIYRCVCCANALFRSTEKFESGTGWPSFWAPIAKENVRNETDRAYGMERTEVLCPECDAHLGHVFDDGPKPTGLRYCMNSVSMNFIKRS